MSSEFINLRWEDVQGSHALRSTGSNVPTFASWQPAGSGGLYQYEFPQNALKEMSFNLQIPHSVAFGTVIRPHVHFTTRSTGTSGVVRWQMEYTIAAINSAFVAPVIIGGSYTFTTNKQDYHLIHNLDSSTVTLPASSFSAFICGRLFRDGGVSPDTFGASVFLLGFDFHCQFDKFGTIGETSAP